jgi:hypothetical protein
MPHNRPISFSGADFTSLPEKQLLGLFVIEMLYRPIIFNVNALPALSTTYYPYQPSNQRKESTNIS